MDHFTTSTWMHSPDPQGASPQANALEAYLGSAVVQVGLTDRSIVLRVTDDQIAQAVTIDVARGGHGIPEYLSARWLSCYLPEYRRG